jgi:hypothetical protein
MERTVFGFPLNDMQLQLSVDSGGSSVIGVQTDGQHAAKILALANHVGWLILV